MFRITREVRLSLMNESARAERPSPGANTWGGWPAAAVICPYLVVRGTFAGEPDAETGYLVDIRRIDEALRGAVLDGPSLAGQRGEVAVAGLWRRVTGNWRERAVLEGLELQTTPSLRYGVEKEDPEMVRITQSFEFAASHRLACAGFSAARNREVFGKCSNANGHGHNYEIEITVRRSAEGGAEGPFSLPGLEAVVRERVLDRFDHKYLNVDCEEFAAVNPSVENIARVIWGLLAGRVEGAALDNVRVWETGKTRADYSEGRKS